MKILITGSSGQLGNQLLGLIDRGQCELGEIHSIYKKSEIVKVNSKELDISDFESVNAIITNIRPDIIINCAAYTNVDGCEKNEEIAFSVNSIGARNLAIVCKKIDAKLIHISTDYVFSGEGIFKDHKLLPYREYDITNPISVYGKTKLLGENYVREFSNKYFIIRTSWIYGEYGNNFVKTILKLSLENSEINVVDDQHGSPTNSRELAYHILKLALTDEYGIYHCSGNGICSWYDFACKIIEYSNINCKVNPIISDNLNRLAKRPKYSNLDNMMLRATIGDSMKNWDESLKDFIDKNSK